MTNVERKRIVLAGRAAASLGSSFWRWRLASQGYEVVVLSRSSQSAVVTPTRSVVWDARTLGPWRAELEGAAAVVNLTGRSVNCRYNAENRRLIMESRVLSTRVIGEAIAGCAHSPAVWLNASTATIYKQPLRPCDG